MDKLVARQIIYNFVKRVTAWKGAEIAVLEFSNTSITLVKPRPV